MPGSLSGRLFRSVTPGQFFLQVNMLAPNGKCMQSAESGTMDWTALSDIMDVCFVPRNARQME
jgi:hypothetical protein